MLYQAIRLGSEIYHDYPGTYVTSYDSALERRWDWDRPEMPNEDEVNELRRFVNSWSSRMQASASDIQGVLHEVLPSLHDVQGKTILDACFKLEGKCAGVERVLGAFSFTRLARCGPKEAWTGASKIMHVINPDLFIMWDKAIRGGYGYADTRDYGEFLLRMQRLAEYAISQIMDVESRSRDSAVESLTTCGHSLAKVLDEYNYVKFTENDDRVWEREYQP